MFRITVLGKPQSKANFRVGFKDPKAKAAYQRYSNYEKNIVTQTRNRLQLKKFETIDEQSLVVVWFFFPDARRRDIHNYTKSLFDAFEKGKIITNDSLFSPVVLMGKEVDRETPRVVAEIYPLSTLEEYNLNVVEKKEASETELVVEA